MHYRDVMDLRRQIPDRPSWCDGWSKAAAECEARAEHLLMQKAHRTAGTELARASLYYHYGQFLPFDNLALKKRTHDRKVAMFRRAAELMNLPFRRVEIPFENIKMAAYLRLPTNVVTPPCVILMGGLDTTKEDYLTVNNLCVERGLATLAFDGPGQGETQFEMLWRRDYERALTAVIDFVAKLPEIDQGRIGLIGRSMGGFFMPRMPPPKMTGSKQSSLGVRCITCGTSPTCRRIPAKALFTSAESKRRTSPRVLRVHQPGRRRREDQAPLLVVHGGLDNITPLDNATKLVKEAGGKTETLIWDDSFHAVMTARTSCDRPWPTSWSATSRRCGYGQ